MIDYAKAFHTKEAKRKALLRAAKAKAEEKYTYHGDVNPKRKPITLPSLSIERES